MVVDTKNSFRIYWDVTDVMVYRFNKVYWKIENVTAFKQTLIHLPWIKKEALEVSVSIDTFELKVPLTDEYKGSQPLYEYILGLKQYNRAITQEMLQ